MGKRNFNDSVISESFFSRNFNDSLISERSKTNEISTDERDYMISKAMRKLNISDGWRKAVARGACYLSGDTFWRLVEAAQSPRIKDKPRYFIAGIGKELRKVNR